MTTFPARVSRVDFAQLNRRSKKEKETECLLFSYQVQATGMTLSIFTDIYLNLDLKAVLYNADHCSSQHILISFSN